MGNFSCHDDTPLIQTCNTKIHECYVQLVSMGFNDTLSLIISHKYNGNIRLCTNYLNKEHNRQTIFISINITNTDQLQFWKLKSRENMINIKVPYIVDFTFNDLCIDIIKEINNIHYPYQYQIESVHIKQSFIDENICYSTIKGYPITYFIKTDIIKKGLYINLKFEKEIKSDSFIIIDKYDSNFLNEYFDDPLHSKSINNPHQESLDARQEQEPLYYKFLE